MKLVNKWNMGLHRFAASMKSRYSLATVLIEEDKTVATDGKVLLEVTLPNANPEQFPVVEGFDASNKGKPFLMSSDDAKVLEKRIPKSRLKPILEHVAIASKGDTAQAATTDLTVPLVSSHRAVEGKYPDYSKVYPTGAACFTIDFDGERLGKFLEYLGKFTSDHEGRVTLEFYDKDEKGKPKPVKLTTKNTDTGQQATGLVMPLEK